MAASSSGDGRGQGYLRATFWLGRIRGIRIGVNWSVALIFAFIAYGLAASQFPAVNPRQSSAVYALAGIVTALVFFASLLAHELAHSLVARRYGLSVESITLWVFGGVSRLGGDPPSPGSETWIAGVGPLTSFLLGGIFVGLTFVVRATGPARASLPGVVETGLAYLGVTNLALFAFNVIPAAPLDGGRLLRAVIWWRTGDRVRSAVWASRVGQVIGWLFTAGGLYAFFITRQWSWLWFSLIGWFIAGSATAEAQQAVMTGRLRGIRVSQVMTPEPVTVRGSMTVSEFLDSDLFRAHHQSFPVTVDGGPAVTGLVTVNRIRRVQPAERDRERLDDLACPLSDVATASPEESVADLLPRLTGCADRRALVLSDGRLVGIVSPSDIARMVERLTRSPS
jgi:Zn-dependent protease/CBS domain-containing protein